MYFFPAPSRFPKALYNGLPFTHSHTSWCAAMQDGSNLGFSFFPPSHNLVMGAQNMQCFKGVKKIIFSSCVLVVCEANL